MALEDNSLFRDGPSIQAYLDPILAPMMNVIQVGAPFVKSDDGSMVIYRESYNETTDPKKKLPATGTPPDWQPDAVEVTFGDVVPMNTQMRKVAMKFSKGDYRKVNAEVYVDKVYRAAAYSIAYQVQKQCVTALQATNNVTTTYFTAKKGAVWSSSTADPLKALRALAADFGAVGNTLVTVMVDAANFYELKDHLEVNDYDLTYAREEVAPVRSFSDHEVLQMRLNVSPAINVVGIHNGLITEGRLLAVGSSRGEPAARTWYYEDPDFATEKLPEYEYLPVMVNPYETPDHRYDVIEAWIDATTVVEKQNAVAYESGEVI
jgi:hypothetical protein